MIKFGSLVRISRWLRVTPNISGLSIANGSQSRSESSLQAAEILKNTGNAQTWLRSLSTAVSDGKSESDLPESQLDKITYERVCSETLDALCDYIEELVEKASNLSGSDVSYSDGVLTVKLGSPYGTYVINRQTPNKQIWLSSPTSGPKRYDFIGPITAETGKWIYRHNGETMHELLQRELQEILRDQKIDFFALPFGK